MDLNQRSDYKISFAGGELWMNSDFGFDGKTAKPVMAVVISDSAGVLSEGNVVLCHYNTFERRSNEYLFGDTGLKESGMSVFAVEHSMIFVWLDKEGNVMPMKDFIIANRVDKKINSSLEIPDTAKVKEEMIFEVVKDGSDNGFKEGDKIVCYKKSDYEITYVWNGKTKTIIRIAADDVLAKIE